jgi:hypothetical protein
MEATMKKIEAFEMRLYRRILRASWTEHITNTEILRRMSKEKEIFITIERRQLRYLGHITRNGNRYNQE